MESIVKNFKISTIIIFFAVAIIYAKPLQNISLSSLIVYTASDSEKAGEAAGELVENAGKALDELEQKLAEGSAKEVKESLEEAFDKLNQLEGDALMEAARRLAEILANSDEALGVRFGLKEDPADFTASEADYEAYRQRIGEALSLGTTEEEAIQLAREIFQEAPDEAEQRVRDAFSESETLLRKVQDLLRDTPQPTSQDIIEILN